MSALILLAGKIASVLPLVSEIVDIVKAAEALAAAIKTPMPLKSDGTPYTAADVAKLAVVMHQTVHALDGQ